MSIERRPTVPAMRAFLEVDLVDPKQAVILIPLKKVGAFERFCVAHELAHYLVYLGFKISPEGKAEYWQHEGLCDDFARHLLMPEAAMKEINLFAGSGLKVCDSLARDAWVPWTQAGIRITGMDRRFIFSRVRRVGRSGFEVFATSRGDGRGRGRPIEEGSPFGKALSALEGKCSAEPENLPEEAALDALKALSFDGRMHPAVQIRYAGDEFRVCIQPGSGDTEGHRDSDAREYPVENQRAA